MARRTFNLIDVVEILQHWYSGWTKSQVAASLGVDQATVAKYVAPADAAGLVHGSPAMSEEAWRSRVREWFPSMVDTCLRQPSWDRIAAHHETIKALMGVMPMSVIHRRLVDEEGLEACVASVRRYLRAHFDEQVRREGGGRLVPAGGSRPGNPGRLRLRGACGPTRPPVAGVASGHSVAASR